MARIILPRNMEVVVASFGGVGTTFLISFLEQYRNVNHHDDEDGIKHLPFPPLSQNKNVKFIYVFGNPQLAAISLFRRNYHSLQSGKLQKSIDRADSPVPQSMTLQEYAANGVDRFYFRNHFYNWYERYLSRHPTLFIRYETLFENVQLLMDFLEMPRSCMMDFPKKKQRNSVMEQIPQTTRQQLDRLYGNFSRELELLPDVEIRQRTNMSFRDVPWVQREYLKACMRQLSFEVKEMLRINAPGIYSFLQSMKQRW